MITLESICQDISYGHTASADTTPTGPKFLRITDIQGGVVDWRTVPYCPKDGIASKSYLEKGDIVIARTGNSTGENFLFDDDMEAVFASYLIRFRVDKLKAIPYYVWLNLRTNEWWNFVAASKTGSAQAGANAKILGQFELPLPDKEIQIKIAAVFKSLAEKIASAKIINQTLEAMAQAIFKSWFVDFDPVRAKAEVIKQGGSASDATLAAMQVISGKTAEQIQAFAQTHPEDYQQLHTTASLFPSAFQESELGEIPEGWEVNSYKTICFRVESGGTPKRNESNYWGGEIKWLSSGEVREKIVLDTKEKISTLGLDNSSAKLWPAFSTVIAMYGATASEVCLLANEMSANQACCALIPKNEYTAFIYLSAQHESPKLAEKASGSAQQNLNKGLIENHQILIPSASVATLFNLVVIPMLRKMMSNYRDNVITGNIRDSLLPKLLSGEIDVSQLTLEE